MAIVKQIKATNNATPYDIGCDWCNIDSLPYNFENLDEDHIKANTLHLGEINGEGGKIVFGNTDGDVEPHDAHFACIEEIGNDELNFKAANFNFEIDVNNGGGQFRVTGGPIIIDAEHYIEGNLLGNADSATYAESAGYADSAGTAEVATTADCLADKSKGSATQPVYINASGRPVACSYSLSKSVPSDAVFTDTKNTVGITTTASKIYLVGATSTSTTTGASANSYTNASVYVNTSGYLVAPTFVGSVSGNATTATTATTAYTAEAAGTAESDSDGNIIKNTYLKLSGGTMTGSIVTPASDAMGIYPKTNNYGFVGSSTNRFYNMYATTFHGALSGNATTASTATNVRSDTTTSAYYLCGTTNASTNTSGILVKRSTVLVNASGNLYVSSGRIDSAGGFYETSDERLKDFSNKIDVDLDKISKIKKHRFTWKGSENKNEEIGVSAQEIRELYPEIVSENEEGYLSVAYDKLAVVALAAIDKLHQENIELKERIIALENKLK